MSVVLEADFRLCDYSQQSLHCDPAYFELGWIHALNVAGKNQAELIKVHWLILHEIAEIAECLNYSKSYYITVSRVINGVRRRFV